MIKAIIFDLDGTLLNTLDGLTDSTNFALSKFGFHSHSTEAIQNFVGDGVKKLIERALPQGIDTPNFEQILAVFKEHYTKTMELKTRPYQGITTLLSRLKEQNIKIAILSNKFDPAVKSLCAKYFQNLYDTAIGESTFTPPKPNPKGAQNILKLLNVNNTETLFVGDSEIDAQTAKNAKIKCIGVSWGFRSRELLIKNNVENIIDLPEELLNFI